MNLVSARGLVIAHDTDAKVLWRKPKHELLAIYRSELAARGAASLMAHRYSKDELHRAILDERFSPADVQLARDTIAADQLGMTVQELVDFRGC